MASRAVRPPMGELLFIGLGLHDERGISLRGLEEARSCDTVFAEFYTSALPGLAPDGFRRLLDKEIRVLTREEVESGEKILDAAARQRVALLVVGDPMAATTHVDLRLRAAAAGIPTRVIPGTSVLTAAAGAVGLQSHKFGRTTTIPFLTASFHPTSPAEVVVANLRAGLHTLVLLDVREEGGFLDPKVALRDLIATPLRSEAGELGPGTLVVVLSHVGSPGARFVTGRIRDLLDRDLGPPPHCLIVPGPLHFLEKEALAAFAGLQEG